VAAAIAIAFAVVGTTDKRSTPPAGVTTTPAPSTTPTTEPASTTTSVPHASPGTPVTVPVTVCPTEQGSTGPNDPHAPATVTISAPPFTTPALAAYSGKRGFLVIGAPAGWSCKAIEAGDGGQGIGATPPGSAPRDSWGDPAHPTAPLTDGVFGAAENACQGCVYSEVCDIVPTAAADFAGFGIPCTRPSGETVIDRGNGVYEYDDPASTIGPDTARSILRYVRKTAQTDASVVRETCILPSSERTVCDALFAEFLSLQPTPWTQPALTIGPTSLGAVGVGDNLFVAQESAGQTFDGAGDGFEYSQAQMNSGLHLYVGIAPGGTNVNNERVACVGAELFPPRISTQRVTTPEGFVLGGTVQQLLAIYGTRATYVAAPPTGMTTNAGYVVHERGGALAFAVHANTVFEIAGGASDITPNSCTG
jgi:hypothetical protein